MTRPKGGMDRAKLILGFRGCRREMDMEAENTIGHLGVPLSLAFKASPRAKFLL